MSFLCTRSRNVFRNIDMHRLQGVLDCINAGNLKISLTSSSAGVSSYLFISNVQRSSGTGLMAVKTSRGVWCTPGSLVPTLFNVAGLRTLFDVLAVSAGSYPWRVRRTLALPVSQRLLQSRCVCKFCIKMYAQTYTLGAIWKVCSQKCCVHILCSQGSAEKKTITVLIVGLY